VLTRFIAVSVFTFGLIACSTHHDLVRGRKDALIFCIKSHSSEEVWDVTMKFFEQNNFKILEARPGKQFIKAEHRLSALSNGEYVAVFFNSRKNIIVVEVLSVKKLETQLTAHEWDEEFLKYYSKIFKEAVEICR
jgi:hypothetical protein